MSVLRSTYYEDVPELDRYGKPDPLVDFQQTVHIAIALNGYVHIHLEDINSGCEINVSIEDAEQILQGLQKAIDGAKKGLI